MSETHIFEGKTTNEAVEKGLKELKLSKNDVDIKVIDNEEKRSFFNILAPRVVKVELTVKPKKEEKAEKKIEKKDNANVKIDEKVIKEAQKDVMAFTDKILEETLEEKIEYKCLIEENVIKIIIDEKKADFLIGYRGEVLNAMQLILNTIACKNTNQRIRVELDVLDYRARRKKALEELAEKIAKSVIRTKEPITLEPMTPYERKIIHTTLQDNSKVKTTSIGEGTHRKVVVSLK